MHQKAYELVDDGEEGFNRLLRAIGGEGVGWPEDDLAAGTLWAWELVAIHKDAPPPELPAP